MKFQFRKLALQLLFLCFVLFIPSIAAYAQTPTPPSLPDLVTVALTILTSLVGFPAALAALINIGLKLGLLDAAKAAWVSFGANVIAFGVIFYLVFTGGVGIISPLDASLSGLAKLLADILIVLGGFAVSFSNTGKYTRSIAEHASHFSAARALYFPGKK
jgi:hypothetical protein